MYALFSTVSESPEGKEEKKEKGKERVAFGRDSVPKIARLWSKVDIILHVRRQPCPPPAYLVNHFPAFAQVFFCAPDALGPKIPLHRFVEHDGYIASQVQGARDEGG
jgi:hypothetical protein